MTNNSIFTRVLALVICLVMLTGTLTACLQEAGHQNHVGTLPEDNGISIYPTTTPTLPGTGNDADNKGPETDPTDPSVIFSASANISSGSLIYGTLSKALMIGSPELGAILPADVKIEAGAQNLALSVKNVEENNVDFGNAEHVKSLDVHINGIAADNTVPMVVNLGAVLEAGLGDTELKLYHIENGTPVLMTRVNSIANFGIHNQYVYDSETGNVTIYVASFSVFTAVQTTASKWEDGIVADTSWYNENDTVFTLEDVADFLGFRDLVDGGNTFEGKTVILGTDIDLANKPFDPIGFGYYKDDKRTEVEGVVTDTNTVFLGTFDGGKHTIYNLYENCWELDPDKTNYGTYTYSTAGAGLFASIKNATIKNIAICGAEVVFECVDMGVLVGYAQGECHFENIVITDANIANYNRYTGGLVGEVSYGVDNNGDGYSHTFKNITIDSTVTVSGLWGSFGCGMGGVIGGKWGDATVKMENVVSAPVMDVYNDVVSAYQWYAFRGCGMLIGHTEEPYSDGRTSGIATAKFLTCENVKVYYGDWVNYTYYQFANQDSGTGRNYPWVRAEAGEYCEAFSNIRYGVPTVDGVKVTAENADELATSSTKIVFNQLYGADRGMYGQAEHEGVTVINKNTKTIYIHNNLDWENLKLHYWYKHGDDTWTNHDVNGIALTEENGVYRVDVPAYAYGFVILADGEKSTDTFVLSELTENETINIGIPTHEHTYDNDCDTTCNECDETREITHTPGAKATCTTAQTCTACDAVINAALGHTSGAIVVENEIASSCTTTGSYDNVVYCTVCEEELSRETITVDAKGHTPGAEATCTTAQTCTVCDAVINAALGHTFDNDVCTVCHHGTKTMKYTFSEYPAGAQYAKNEEHKLDEYVTITTTQCHFTSELRIYASDTHNGYAIIYSVNPISTIAVNAGANKDTLNIYVSNDGINWSETPITISVTSTSYEDYEASLNGEYKYIKLDVEGANQIRIKSMELTTVPDCTNASTTEKVVAPTCTEAGYTNTVCSSCDKVIKTVAGDPATGHVNTTKTTVDATCTEAGSITVTCACGDVVSIEEIPATGHVNTTKTTVDASCTKAGSITVTCACSYVVSTEVIPATGHTFVNGTCGCGATESTGPTWILTNIADIKADDVVVIVWTKGDTSWALTSANGSSSAPTAIVVTVSGDQLTGDIADALKWNISNDNGNLTIYPNGTTATWLYCTSTNNGVRVGTNTNKTFTLDTTSGYLKHTATSRYLGVYNAQDVRCYTSHTTDNIKNQTIAFYVLTNGGASGGGTTPEPEHVCESVCVTCGKCTDAECTYDVCKNNQCEGHSATPTTSATFELGANGSASHNDGSSKTSYSETKNGYTLNITGGTNMYTGARDAKGNSCIKLGASSKAGSFTFTVPNDVNKVVIYVAQYKANTTKITVNGTSYTITTASDNGAYTAIEIDTSTTKTITLTTVSGGYRAMVNTIEFWG